MKKTIKNAALAALVAIGAFAAVPAAQAEGFYLGFGDRGASFGFVIGPDGHRHYPRGWHDRRDWREVRACTPRRAVDKAHRLGFKRVEVERVGRNRIRVSGRRWGERVNVVFGRSPNCPVLH